MNSIQKFNERVEERIKSYQPVSTDRLFRNLRENINSSIEAGALTYFLWIKRGFVSSVKGSNRPLIHSPEYHRECFYIFTERVFSNGKTWTGDKDSEGKMLLFLTGNLRTLVWKDIEEQSLIDIYTLLYLRWK